MDLQCRYVELDRLDRLDRLAKLDELYGLDKQTFVWYAGLDSMYARSMPGMMARFLLMQDRCH